MDIHEYLCSSTWSCISSSEKEELSGVWAFIGSAGVELFLCVACGCSPLRVGFKVVAICASQYVLLEKKNIK